MKSDDLKVMCKLLVTALIIALLLIVSGNVEPNPGPIKKCLKCEKMMPITRTSNNCKCGHLLWLCCVAARVLHFSAFILFCFVSINTNVNFLLTRTVYYIHAYSVRVSISEHKFK